MLIVYRNWWKVWLSIAVSLYTTPVEWLSWSTCTSSQCGSCILCLNASYALVATARPLLHAVTYNRYCVCVHKHPSSIHCHAHCMHSVFRIIFRGSIMLWLLLFMQVLLLLVSLAFHKVFITIRSFLKAVTGETSLHFLSDSPFSEIGLEKKRLIGLK